MYERSEVVPEIILQCAERFSPLSQTFDWVHEVFYELYMWYFVPRRPDLIREARRTVTESYTEFCRSGEVPSWFVSAARYLLSQAEEIVDVETYDTTGLTPLEVRFHKAALEWSIRNKCALGGMPSSEELRAGARSYTAYFLKTGISPWFARLPLHQV